MAKILIVYYSRTGNTEKMAKLIKDGVLSEGVDAELKKVKDTTINDLLSSDGIIMGSPTYYGTMAAELKKLIDDSVSHHGSLDGKVGAAFSSSANVGGGNETTVLDILKAMLIHGMIVQGDPKGDHYGPVSINAPDKRSASMCTKLGVRTAKLVKILFT
ncbi:MAG: flavodoxin family protein [Candidatus Helarchaeota archaeon]|nr:flavodoxin family protein [Candidatus Helarchaeota archaeon]